MEQNIRNGLMGQRNSSGLVSYSSADNRSEALGSVNQRFTPDPSSSVNMNLRPSDLNTMVGARPVHYSIQTGEEFALEFMWERVNPRQQHIPNSSVEANIGTTYMDPQAMLVASYTGSGRGPDASLLPSLEKNIIQDPVRTGSLIEEKNSSKPIESVAGTLSENNNSREFQSHSSLGSFGVSSRMLKLLCSFGGKIMPRPSDRKFRYVGGETRIIRIRKDISWAELKQKTLTIYNQPHSIRYQLPDEDLDALVSVSCDEDLQNMIDECYGLGDGGSQKLRIFLISNSDLDDSQLGLESVEGDSEMQYVVAVNCMDVGSRRNSIAYESHLGNNLDELISAQRETAGTALSFAAGEAAHPEVNPNQSSQVALPSLSHASESTSLGYQAQTINCEQPERHSSHASKKMDTFSNADEKTKVPGSVTFQYDYGSHSINHEPLPQSPVPVHIEHVARHEAHAVGQSYSNANVQEVSSSEVKHNYERSVQKKTEFDKDTNMNTESTIGKFIDPAKVNYLKNEEAAVVGANKETSVIQTKNSDKNQDEIRNFIPSNIFQEEASTKDVSYEPPVLPLRSFQSERIRREQLGINRWSKSDDSSGPQLLMNHSRSDVSQQITESADKFTDWNVMANLEEGNASVKSVGVNPPSTVENLKESQRLTEDVDDISVTSSIPDQSPKSNKPELNAAVLQHTLTSGSSFPKASQEKSEFPKDEFAQKLMDIRCNQMNENASEGQLHPQGSGEDHVASSQSKLPTDASTPEHGDIRIDVNDRFPHDLLSDIFSEAGKESTASGTLLHGDAAGLSVNMTNHEPKHWSFFQMLARDDSRNDVSLMDQDHPTTSSSVAQIGEDVSRDYGYPPFVTGAVAANLVDSSNNLGADIQRLSSNQLGPDVMSFPSDYDVVQTAVAQNQQFNHPATSRTAGSDHEKAVQPTGFPLVDISLGNFDPNTLQIIKNRDLEQLRELGSGTYGTVYHGKWRGTDVAIKRIKKSCFTGRSSEQERLTSEFWHEAEILSKLHHPNVVAFYGVVQDGPGGTLATVTEYMVNGSLRHALISKDRHLDRRKRLIIAMDAAFGMEYLHSRNIVHFDLKCDNLLVNLKDLSRPICKVGDFGLSKIKRNTLVTGGVRGTLPWMAPELLNGSSSKVSEKVDVFSFGIVLWEILTGEEPYANMHYGAIIGGIVNNSLRPHVPSSCDPDWKLLMEQCWAPDPLVRPSFTQIARRLRTMSTTSGTKTPQGVAQHNQLPK
ncbi:hypothetical protein ACJIZ3_008540 [Penstemon smallii]|uniref:Protein kinase domain-containing protein n=1 Tax=Penstemon smallii TaxID=265156 RepID=A0ABD3TA39_9LAMI